MAEDQKRSFVRHSRAYYARRYPLGRNRLDSVTLKMGGAADQYADRRIEVYWYDANGSDTYHRWVPMLSVGEDDWAFLLGEECADLCELLSALSKQEGQERVQPGEFCEGLEAIGFVDATETGQRDRAHWLRELKAERDELDRKIEAVKRGEDPLDKEG